MPSGLTHMLLVQYARNELNPATHRNLSFLMADMIGPMVVGSVAPDLPYASAMDADLFFSMETEIADRFHYECTNEIPLRALKTMRDKKKTGENNLELTDALFGFFTGYASHVIADGIVHPFVRDKVGDYGENKTAHRVLEMRLDVLLCYALVGGELNLTNVQGAAEYFNGRHYKEAICAEFARLIREVYGQSQCARVNQADAREIQAGKVAKWVGGLMRLFDIAAGDFPRWYRKLSALGAAYNNVGDLINKKDDFLVLTKAVDAGRKAGVVSNFLGRDRIHFLEDCVPRFNTKFIAFITKAYAYVYEDGPELGPADLPAINLDTGRALADSGGDDLSKIPVLWS